VVAPAETQTSAPVLGDPAASPKSAQVLDEALTNGHEIVRDAPERPEEIHQHSEPKTDSDGNAQMSEHPIPENVVAKTDSEMTDASQIAPEVTVETPLQNLAPEEEVPKPTEPDHPQQTPAISQADATDQKSTNESEMQVNNHATNSTSIPADQAAQPHIPESTLSVLDPDTTVETAPAESSSLAPLQTSDAQNQADGTGVSAVPERVDTTMLNSSTSLARSREEDDNEDERSAKRLRLEETALETPIETPINEFKRPEPPTPVSASINPLSAMANLPPRPAFSTAPLSKVQRKILEDKLKNTKKVKSAGPFLRPVDYMALNIPNYPNVIKIPMDLGTMDQKLKADEYESLEAFAEDFEIMVNNCFTFNGPAHAVSGLAQNLRAYFLKQMESVPSTDAAAIAAPKPKKESPAAKPQPRRESRVSISGGSAKSPGAGETFALLPGGTPQIRRDSNAGRPKRTVIPPPSRDLPYSGAKPKRKENMAGLKFCEHVHDVLMEPRYDKLTLYFRDPVDPVALNIPHYFHVIKHPMDLGTIGKKIKNGEYSTADECKSDFDLVFTNCFKFNPPENIVHIAAKELQNDFEQLWKTKSAWIKKNAPPPSRASPTSDVDSGDESSEEEADVEDPKEATIKALKEQLANMQNMLGQISGTDNKKTSPKPGNSKKKSRASGGASSTKSKKSASAGTSKSSSKSKAKKQRLVTYEEKQEISNATERMDEAQLARLTTIITENVSKYKVTILYMIIIRIIILMR